MTDEELLKAAAKAAGYDYRPQNRCIVIDGIPGSWNPLADDGDALRLAVKLKMGISIPVHKTIRADVISFLDSSVCAKEIAGDEYAATRRAIVRAAAAMANV